MNRIQEIFSRPLRFGDPEQIAVLKAMNGDELYCPDCGQKCGDDLGEDIRYLRCEQCACIGLQRGARCKRFSDHGA